ncbi:hypothetical protein B296_00039549 [Ensete ventricosum]|uniref:Uncharacterized protein n=1 Tax=Ensete ventricosum TaxID=4639 RepID=A0A426YPJ1_ENSVE|nr:hypothetical protein B296_00039549 [Ensete ventricosum]
MVNLVPLYRWQSLNKCALNVIGSDHSEILRGMRIANRPSPANYTLQDKDDATAGYRNWCCIDNSKGISARNRNMYEKFTYVTNRRNPTGPTSTTNKKAGRSVAPSSLMLTWPPRHRALGQLARRRGRPNAGSQSGAGRLYEHWRSPYIRPVTCVGSATSAGQLSEGVMTWRSGQHLSYHSPPPEDLLEAPDEGVEDEVLHLIAGSRSP